MGETICWECTNCTGFCEWSRDFKPVEGWKATKGRYGMIVKSCPKFQKDPREKNWITIMEVVKQLKTYNNYIYRHKPEEVVEMAKARGLRIRYDSDRELFYLEEEE